MGMQVGQIDLGLNVDQSKFNKQLSGLAKGAESKTASIFSGLGKKIGLALGTAAIGSFVKSCLDLGSDLSEVQNVVDTTFTSMSNQVNEFAKNAMNDFGLSETVAKKYTGTLGTMSKSMGFSEKAAYDMATSVTGLAGDVASFYNLSSDEAYNKLKSIWTGETESIKDLGVVMTQTALDQYALNNGFGKTTAKMTEQEKVMLRYQYVMSSLAGAQGDFARTSDSWANQTRILGLQFESLKATLGQGFINLFTPIIKVINTLLGKLVSLASGFKSFTEMIMGKKSDASSGISNVADSASEAMKATDGLANSAGSIGDKTKESVKKAKKELAGFDMINKLSKDEKDSGSGSGAGSGTGASFGGPNVLDQVGTSADNASSKVNSMVASIAQQLNKMKKLYKKGFFDGLGDSFKKNASQIVSSCVGIKDSVVGILGDKEIHDAARTMLDRVSYSLGSITGSFASVGVSIATNILNAADTALRDNSGIIKQAMMAIWDYQGDAIEAGAGIADLISDIFGTLTSGSGMSITANLTSTFTEVFATITMLGANFGSDLLNAIVEPIITNKDKIVQVFQGILDAIAPVTEGLKDGVGKVMDTLMAVYDGNIGPAIGELKEMLTDLFATFLDIYNKYFAPVIQGIGEKLGSLINDHIAPFVSSVVEFLGEISETIMMLLNNYIKPIIQTVAEVLGPIVSSVIEGIGDVFDVVFTTIFDICKGFIDALKGLVQFIKGVFTGDWKAAWNGIKSFFKGIIDSLKAFFKGLGSFFTTIFKNACNSVKGFFQGAWNGVKGIWGGAKKFFSGIWSGIKGAFGNVAGWFKDVFSKAWTAVKNVFCTGGKIFDGIKDGIANVFKDVVNTLITGINKVISFPFNKINDLLNGIRSVSIFGLEPFSGLWDRNPLPVPQIPKLAQGGFVKANTPQLAMIGDNRHQGEVVAPEDKLKEMAMEAVRAAGGNSGDRDLLQMIIELLKIIIDKDDTIYLDSEKIKKKVVSKINAKTKQTGKCEIILG